MVKGATFQNGLINCRSARSTELFWRNTVGVKGSMHGFSAKDSVIVIELRIQKSQSAELAEVIASCFLQDHKVDAIPVALRGVSCVHRNLCSLVKEPA